MKPGTLQRLTVELQSGSDRQRRAASYKLGKSKDPAVVPVLIAAFEDADATVRQNVIDGLRKIGSAEALNFLEAHATAASPAPGQKPTLQSTVTTGALALIIGIFVCILVGAVASGIGAIGTGLGRLADLLPLKSVLQVAAVLLVGVLNPILAAFLIIRRPQYASSRATVEDLLDRWLYSGTEILVVILVALDQPEGLASIGIRRGDLAGNRGAVFEGMLAFAMAVWSLALIFRFTRRRPNDAVQQKLDLTRPDIAGVLLYRNLWQRLASLAVLSFGVVGEDLVFCGFLVLLLAHRTGTYVPWVVLSILLTVLVHLYQGKERNLIILHFVQGIFLVGLTLLAQNILAPVTAHFLYDFAVYVGIWRRAGEQRLVPAVDPPDFTKKLAYGTFVVANLIVLWLAAIWIMS